LSSLRSRGHRLLCDTLKYARRKARLSQEDLAAKIGEVQSYVSKVEGGTQDISPVKCNAWATACGMPVRDFWDRWLTLLERRVWK